MPVDGHAEASDRIDRLRDNPILKDRLRVVKPVINNDISSSDLPRYDVGREAGLTRKSGGETHLSAGRQVVHDLQHRRAFG